MLELPETFNKRYKFNISLAAKDARTLKKLLRSKGTRNYSIPFQNSSRLGLEYIINRALHVVQNMDQQNSLETF